MLNFILGFVLGLVLATAFAMYVIGKTKERHAKRERQIKRLIRGRYR